MAGASEEQPYRSPPGRELGELERVLRAPPGGDSSISALWGAALIGALVAGGLFESVWVGAGVLGVAVVALGVITALAARRTRAEIRQGGFVLCEGRKRSVVYWQDVASLGRDDGVPPSYWVTLESGGSVGFDDRIDGARELADRIQAEMLPRLLPGLAEQLQRGERCRFGVIAIGSAGLATHDQPLVPWERIERVAVSGGRFVARRRGESRDWLSIPLREIPNLALLWALLEQAVPRALPDLLRQLEDVLGELSAKVPAGQGRAGR